VESVSYRLDDLKSGTIKVRTFSTADGPRREPHSLFPNRFIVFKKHEIVFSKSKTIFTDVEFLQLYYCTGLTNTERCGLFGLVRKCAVIPCTIVLLASTKDT